MFGFFGKIPAHGDFIRSRGKVSFINEWDGFLQQGLAESRRRLKEDWDVAYQNSPIWRFLLEPDICGGQAVTGVLMPSQDRVGRRFPLTLFHPLMEPAGPELLDDDPLMTELENIALACLDAQIDKGELIRRLAAVDFSATPAAGNMSRQSYWLSTFFGGAARRDACRFDGLPEPARFEELLSPDRGQKDV